MQERVVKQGGLIHEQEREQSQRENLKGRTERDRYRAEVGGETLRQRELFGKLVSLGVVDVIRELHHGAPIPAALTKEEQGQFPDSMEKFLEETGQVRPDKDSRDKDLHFSDTLRWDAYIADPTMNEDGSPSKTLIIELHNLGRKNYKDDPDEYVRVSFSPAGVLTVIGERVTFSEVFDEEQTDLDAFSDGLARAVVRPYKMDAAEEASAMTTPRSLAKENPINEYPY